MAEKKLSEELRHCLEDDACGDCQYHKPQTKLICRGLLQKAYEEFKSLEQQEQLPKSPCAIGKARRSIVNNHKYIIKVFKKQIPKKPIIYKGTNRADCPNCGATVRGIGKPFGNYCSYCGQKLNWKD